MSRCARGLTCLLVSSVWFGGAAQAYTAAGDRIFTATLVLPQVAPSDEVYGTVATQPGTGGRQTDLSGIYGKTLTERLGVAIEETYSWVDRAGGRTASGVQQLELTVRYLVIQDLAHEFLLTVGVAQEIGGTESPRVSGDRQGATTPTVYFAKGLGDVDIGYLRPFALLGTMGYEKADGDPRPDRLRTGIALEYSFPYLESKVASLGLPEPLRHMTPIVEYVRSAPVTLARGNATVGTVAPGVIYSGEGWEFGIEALVPTTRATGNGVGVTAQFHLSLDFFFPNTIGRPLFADR